jgi:putative MATE family efflux protein
MEAYMSTKKTSDSLTTERIGKLMRTYSIPCVLSLLVGALYNIVDQLFISNASYLGSYGNAANSVVFPLTVAALSVAVMIGDGSCAFVSIARGRRADSQAARSIGNAVSLTLLSSLVLTAACFLFMKPLLICFGASVSERTYALAQEYFTYIAMGFPFYMFGQAMNPIIRADGAPRFAMAANLSGDLLNVILDPIMIFPLHWGMMGAAVATVLGQILTAALSVWYLRRSRTVHLDRSCFHVDWKLDRQFLPLGMTSFLSQISVVASMAAVNTMVAQSSALDPVFSQPQYAQIPMAVLGIVMKFFQIVISVSVGLAAGCIPLVGYNTGAGRPDRVRSLFTTLLTAEGCTGLAGLILTEFFPQSIIGLFGASQESAYYTQFALRSFRLYLCMMIPACINKGSFIFLQALGRGRESTLLSLFREIVLGVGLTLVLGRLYGLNGVLYSMPASDLCAFAASVLVIRTTYRRLDSGIRSRTDLQVQTLEA